MKRMFRKIMMVLIVVVMFISFSGLSVKAETTLQDEFVLLSSSDLGVKFEVIVPWEHLRQDIINEDGQSFSSISLPEWLNMSREGEPALPFMTQALGVPFGVSLSVKVVPGKAHTIKLSAPVLPSPTQESLLDLAGLDLETNAFTHAIRPSLEIYDSDEAYPGILAEITNDGVLRQQRVAGIGVYPVQYHPISNTLTIYENLQVEVVFEGTPTITQDAASVESDVFEAIFQSTLMNYEEARNWRSLTEKIQNLESAAESLQVLSNPVALPWQPPEPGWRVSIEEDGLYELTYAELQLAGLLVDEINPQTFQMFHFGEEIAIQVIGEGDLSFDEGDAIIFYGQGIDSKYAAKNVYWLTYGDYPGLRMEIRVATPLGENTPSYYSAKLHMEENHYYRSVLPGGGELERFYWQHIQTSQGGTWSKDFYVEEPYASPSTLQIALFGSLQIAAINPDHHAIISINETQVADVRWDGLTWAGDGFVEAEIPEGLLGPGLNTLTVFLPNDTGSGIDLVFIDWAKINYPNTFSVNTGENALAFSYDLSGTWKFQVSGFNSDALVAYDVSNPWEVAVFDSDSLIIENLGSEYRVAFEDEVLTEKAYWVATDSSIMTVLASDIVEDAPSNLQSTDKQADYTLISHPAFMAEAAALSDHRASQGLSTILVDVQDVYDEFGFGIVSADAIREFLAYTAVSWQAPAPSFVVLVGDGNYDPKNYLGKNKTSFIPPFLAMVDPWIGETAADNRYVSFSGPESIPDMILGRLSVNSAAEASNVIAKIISYEQAPVEGDWTTQVLAVAGAADSAGDFAAYSDGLIADTLPEPYQAERVYYGVTHTDIAEAVAALKAGINSGKLIVNFIGHGFARGWSAQKNPPEIFIQTTDVAALTNLDKYPIFLAMTCSEGYYIDPAVEAFGEAVTRAENKGAIASWSPTGQGVSGGHDYMDRGFFDAVYKHGSYVLGEAILGGFSRLWFSGSSLYLMETYELFGDPALIINRTPAAVDDFYNTAEDFDIEVDAENGVLKNDFGFAPGNALSTSLETDVTYGQLDLVADGSFSYIPAADWFGEEEFTYNVSDGGEFIGIATATIKVHPINDAPVGYSQSVVTLHNTSVEIILTGSDVDDILLGYVITRYPEHGILTPNVPPGPGYLLDQNLEPGLIYQPDTGYFGMDSFDYVVYDGKLMSDPALISITVELDGVLVFLPLIIR